MARLPRLLLDHHAHLLSQRVQQGQMLARDDVDRARWHELLRRAVARDGVALYAWALVDDRFELLAAAPQAVQLSRLMQSLARDHAAAYNRRHGRHGGLWQGRFRAAVVEPGDWLLRCMLHVDRLGGGGGDPRWSSRAVHEGSASDAALVMPGAYWALGNTPFEREAAYRERLQEPPGMAEQARIEAALRGGWALGSPEFTGGLAEGVERPVAPRPRGRPRRSSVASH